MKDKQVDFRETEKDRRCMFDWTDIEKGEKAIFIDPLENKDGVPIAPQNIRLFLADLKNYMEDNKIHIESKSVTTYRGENKTAHCFVCQYAIKEEDSLVRFDFTLFCHRRCLGELYQTIKRVDIEWEGIVLKQL